MSLKATKISTAAADNFRLMKGKLITSADGDGDYIAFECPRKSFVSYLSLTVKTALTTGSTGSVVVGSKEPGVAIDADRFADNLVTLPEATGDKVIPVGTYLENGGVITLGVTKGNSAANFVGSLFVKYAVIH